MPFLSSAFSQPRATSWPRLFSIAQKEPLSDLRAGQAPLTLAARAGRAEHRGSLQLAHLRHHREPFLFACTSLCLRTGMSAPVRALGAQSNQSEVPEAALTSLGKSVGVVVVDHGSRRAESNANLGELSPGPPMLLRAAPSPSLDGQAGAVPEVPLPTTLLPPLVC